jgi:hypothetical protein
MILGSTKASSTGCITIYKEDYYNFMKATGLDKNMSVNNSYYASDLISGKTIPPVTGAVVIDRSLSDPVHLQTMYKNQNTVDIIMGK